MNAKPTAISWLVPRGQLEAICDSSVNCCQKIGLACMRKGMRVWNAIQRLIARVCF